MHFSKPRNSSQKNSPRGETITESGQTIHENKQFLWDQNTLQWSYKKYCDELDVWIVSVDWVDREKQSNKTSFFTFLLTCFICMTGFPPSFESHTSFSGHATFSNQFTTDKYSELAEVFYNRERLQRARQEME